MNEILSKTGQFFKTAYAKTKEALTPAWEWCKKQAAVIKDKISSGEQNENKKSTRDKILTGAGLALCVVFAFMLVCNLAIIIKGSLSPEKPPSVLGITPMVVLSGSMSGDAKDHIETGDLIFVRKADPEKLEVGDVIAFMEGSTTVTHRIIREEIAEDGTVQWITKGDANNAEDQRPVTAENLVGVYSFRLPKVGDFALFLQKPVGMLIFIGIPCLAFLIYDIIRRQRTATAADTKKSEMEAELERLRQLVAEQSGGDTAPAHEPEYPEDDEDYDDEDYDEESEEDEDDSDEDYDEESEEESEEDFDEESEEDYDG